MGFGVAICFCLTLIIGIYGKQERIYGGSPASITDYAHMVSIRVYSSNQIICAGSIISRWNVLTAAHCFNTFLRNYHTLRIFSGTASSVNVYGNNHEIEDITFHPEFIKYVNPIGMFPHNIAIVTLHAPMEFNEFQNKIALPTRPIFSGNMAVVTGWGLTENSVGYETSNVLMKLPVVILDSLACTPRLPIPVVRTQFCTFHSFNSGICNGDAGGSVTSNGELYGIIAYTVHCAQGLPDIHTQVYNYLDFIRQHMIE